MYIEPYLYKSKGFKAVKSTSNSRGAQHPAVEEVEHMSLKYEQFK